MKLWDTRAGAPVLLQSKNLKIGAVFSMRFASDEPLLLGAGGSKGKVAVWDLTTEAAVSEIPWRTT